MFKVGDDPLKRLMALQKCNSILRKGIVNIDLYMSSELLSENSQWMKMLSIARLWDPIAIATMSPDNQRMVEIFGVSNQLLDDTTFECTIPWITCEDFNNLLKEKETYILRASSSQNIDPWQFFKLNRNSNDFPTWVKLAKKWAVIAPSSASVERVFIL